MVDFKGGRLPNDVRKRRVRIRRAPGEALTPPPSADWGDSVLDYMALNDEIGDCTIASECHMVSSQQVFGQNQNIQIGDQVTLQAYSEVSGYDPRTGANDNGATIQDAMSHWRKTGLAGYKIEAFAQIDSTDLDMVRTCVDAFGAVNAGMNFPDFAMDQFDARKVWDIPQGKRWRNEGGHCVPILAYGPGYLDCWTYGRRQRMTLDFYLRFFDETWAVADANWQRPDGTVPNGIDGRRANAEFLSLVGSPGPFSEGDIPPVPVPDPVSAGDADTEYWAQSQAWAARKGLI